MCQWLQLSERVDVKLTVTVSPSQVAIDPVEMIHVYDPAATSKASVSKHD